MEESDTTGDPLKNKKKVNSLFGAVFWVAPVVVIFFFVGVFVGSQIMNDAQEDITNRAYHDNGLLTPTSGAQSALRGAITKLSAIEEDPFINSPPIRFTENLQQPPELKLIHKVVVDSPKPPVNPNPVAIADAAPVAQPVAEKKPQPKQLKRIPFMQPETLASSLHIDESSYFRGPQDLDNDAVVAGAWIRLDDIADNDNDMRTIFTNKGDGCSAEENQYGFSLFVNEWQTKDHQLITEFGNSVSGCNKLSSGNVRIDPLKWYHVAVYHNRMEAALYVNGEEVNYRDFSSGHAVQSRRPLLLGRFEGGKFPFYGNISHVTVLHPVSTASGGGAFSRESMTELVPQLMGDMATLTNIPSLYALLPLTDSHKKLGVVLRPNSRSQPDPQRDSGIFYGSSVAGGSVAVPNIDGRVMKTGIPEGRVVTQDMIDASDREARIRREKVKKGMQHVWKAYKRYAWGYDELKPISKRGQDNWGGMGVTLVDALDTLWIMGMKDEFNEARDWVKSKLTFDHAGSVSTFETTIRELGGLLSAYDLSGESIFLDKAQILGRKLAAAFNTPSGIARSSVDLRSGSSGGSSSVLAELGTLQVEFRYLAHKTRDTDLEKRSMKGIQLLSRKGSGNGLYPIRINTQDGSFADSQITFGALGDSFYEYLLKMWIQGGKREAWLRKMYDNAMDGAIRLLLKTSTPSNFAFLSDFNGRTNNLKMDHLVCFMPGVLTLGAYTDPNGLNSERAQRDLSVAKALMYTCYQMYKRQPTGISPEYVDFHSGVDMVVGRSAPFYILRPEVVESLFVMHQLTKEPLYRDWSFEIFEAIERNCRVENGYATLRDVSRVGSGVDDRMESFFLAETMKYLYMIQDPENIIDLTKYVINTEAHPLKILDDSHVPINQS